MTTEGRGLTEREVERSRAQHGSNALSQKKRKGFFQQFISNFGDPIIKILLAALAVNLIFLFRNFDWYETRAPSAVSVTAPPFSWLWPIYSIPS